MSDLRNNPFADVGDSKPAVIGNDPYEEETIPVGNDGEEYEEIEEEVEVEVGDSENEGETLAVTSPVLAPVAASSVTGGGLLTPGKVAPSPEVASMKHLSPESVSVTSSSLKPNKNPFTSIEKWTSSDFSEIKIIFHPLGSGETETTNVKTRETNPSKRFWGSFVRFSWKSYSSDTIRVSNVAIPFTRASKYGSDDGYVYMRLPGWMADHFRESGKILRPTTTKVGRLVSNSEVWWVRASNIKGRFGVLDKSTGKFHPKSVASIFSGTNSGIIVNAILKFKAKANTDDRADLEPTHIQKVDVELVRGFIQDFNVDVQSPEMEATAAKQTDDPKATKQDYASDDLLRRLRDLGV